MGKALVINSGGLDSLYVLHQACKIYNDVATIVFDYGQRNRVELQYAAQLSYAYGCELHHVVELPIIAAVTNTPMTNKSLDFGKHPTSDKMGNHYVPNRNAIFLALAQAYADTYGYEALYTGMGGIAPGGAPDSEAPFVRKMTAALRQGNPVGAVIYAPLMGITKKEIWEWVGDEGIRSTAVNNTFTCQAGDEEQTNPWGFGCGECPACKLRASSYHEVF